MSRVCLVGMGDPSLRPARVHAGPGLRTGHFATALLRAGHELLVVSVHNGSSASDARAEGQGELAIEGRTAATLDVSEAAFAGGRAADRVRAFAPDALVGVTALGASLACRLRLDVPLWADVFGDPMAEAQAKAVVCGHDGPLARFWCTLQPVLDRADRFSAVSRAQADALVGQLGMAGRLGARNAGAELVSVIPCAAEPAGGAVGAVEARGGATGIERCGAEPDVAADAFLVSWSGSFNTWCDVETLLAGLEQAMDVDPAIVFVATGGAVAGHDETTFSRFAAAAAHSRHARRMYVLGWVPSTAAARWMRRADLGVVAERRLYERRLGSENRVVHWMARGVPCVTSGMSELGASLVELGLAVGYEPGDAASLAAALIAAARERARTRERGAACREHCAAHFGFETTAAPLVAWCAAPVHAADHGEPRRVSIGLFSEPQSVVRLLESYLDELHVGQIAYRSLRWLSRRALRALRRPSAGGRMRRPSPAGANRPAEPGLHRLGRVE